MRQTEDLKSFLYTREVFAAYATDIQGEEKKSNSFDKL